MIHSAGDHSSVRIHSQDTLSKGQITRQGREFFNLLTSGVNLGIGFRHVNISRRGGYPLTPQSSLRVRRRHRIDRPTNRKF